MQEFGLDKGYKGYVSFLEQDTKAIIHAGESADFSTFVHEAAHIFRRQLTGELLKKAENAFGVSNGQWSEEQEEKFAVGLEEFIRTRTETNTDKKVVYEKGSKFIQNVYSDVEKIIDISPEMQEVYESLFNKADELINKTGVTIINDQGDRSFFRPSTDVIHLCPKNMYDSPEAYYGTVLHELTHWTGVESRLNRDSLKDYEIRENRAREELIAEIGSYQLCKSLHLDFSPQNNIAYVQGWVKALHKSPEEIFKATTAAAAAKEFITNIEGERVLEHEIKSPNLTPKLKSYEDQISDIVTTAMKYNKEPWNKSIGNETVIPPYNPVSGQIYEPAILDTHAAINGHSDKRYLSSNDIHECNKTIVENSNPIVIAHTKGNVVKYDMLFNVEEINDIPKTKLPSLVSKTECKQYDLFENLSSEEKVKRNISNYSSAVKNNTTFEPVELNKNEKKELINSFQNESCKTAYVVHSALLGNKNKETIKSKNQALSIEGPGYELS